MLSEQFGTSEEVVAETHFRRTPSYYGVGRTAGGRKVWATYSEFPKESFLTRFEIKKYVSGHFIYIVHSIASSHLFKGSRVNRSPLQLLPNNIHKND